MLPGLGCWICFAQQRLWMARKRSIGEACQMLEQLLESRWMFHRLTVWAADRSEGFCEVPMVQPVEPLVVRESFPRSPPGAMIGWCVSKSQCWSGCHLTVNAGHVFPACTARGGATDGFQHAGAKAEIRRFRPAYSISGDGGAAACLAGLLGANQAIAHAARGEEG